MNFNWHLLKPLLVLLLLLPIIVLGQAPTFSSFGSSSTSINSSLVITGTNFTGTTSVLFGGTPASYTVNSSTQITATVPRVANSGPLRITNGSGSVVTSSIPVTRESSLNSFSSVTTAFNSIDVGAHSIPTFIDLDGDGLLDMLIGEWGSGSTVSHYEQNAANGTSFTLRTNSFNGIVSDYYCSTTFTDLDGDGLLDMIVGNYIGTLSHYEQSDANSTSFTLRTASFNGIDVGDYSSPTFTDLDGDGLLDLIVGKNDGTVNHYEQSSANSTSFALRTATFNSIDVGNTSIPTLMDIDGDGLLDLLIGEQDGNFNHYEQNAANSTSFTLITANFNSIDVGLISAPTFTDLDGDGLLDMILGEQLGTLLHYEQNQLPFISSFSANPACQNATVSITGTGFTGATSVTINGTSVSTLSGVTATNINFTVPANATSGNVVVTTPNGTSDAVAITIISAPTAPTIAGATSFCLGSSTTLTTTYTLGIDEAYLWSDNSSASTLTVSAAGTYSLRIRNTVTGCTSSVSNSIIVTVTALPATPAITGGTAICAGNSTTLTTTRTLVANEAYLWSNGTTTASNVVSTAGTYTLRIRNTVTGCTSAASNTIALVVNPLPTTPTIAGATSICSGSNTILTTTYSLGPNEQYLWSNNSNGSTLSVTAAGTYSLRIRNTVTGCSSAISNAIVVTVNPIPGNLTVTPASPASTCETAVTLTASASVGNTYQWKLNGTDISGATSNTYIAPSTGSYTVVAVTSLGCTSAAASNAVAVTVNPQPTFTSFGSSSTTIDNDLVINGTNFTGITSVLFGQTPAQFIINSSTQITATVPRVANTCRIRLTNSGGCNVLTTAIPVTRESSLNSFSSITTAFNSIDIGAHSISAFTDLDGDGLLDMLVGEFAGAGNVALSHYEQNAANSTSFTLRTNNFNGIFAGTYCSPTFTDLDGDGLLDMLIGLQDGTINHFEQNAANSTSFTLRSASFNGIDVGDYSTPTFTDLDGDCLLDLIIGKTDGTLNHYEQNGANSTSFTLVTNNFNGIDVGNNSTPTLTDLDGDGLLDILIGEADGNINHYEQNAANSTSFTLTSSNINSIDVGLVSAPSFTDLDGDGLLDMIVGEQQGTLIHYKQNQLPFISTFSANPACQNATVSITGTGFTGATSVTLNGTSVGILIGVTATNITFTLPANATSGNVVVTTPLGISDEVAITIIPAPTAPTISGSGLTSICPGSSTTLTTTYTLGTDEAYLWSDNSSASTLTVSAAGTYSLRIRNTATGCTSAISNAIVVTSTALPATPTITGTANYCPGSSTTLTASSSTAYLWSTGETTQSISVNTAGSYTVRRIANGCTSAASAATNVTVLAPTPTITGNSFFCAGGSTILTSSSATGNIWSTGATTQTLTVTTAGSYSVRRIVSGCTSLASTAVDVIVNPLPTTPTITGATSFCAGSSNTLSTAYSLETNEAYLWSNNSSLSTLTVSTAGTYSLRIRNTVTGCTSTISNAIVVSVTALPATPTITGGTAICAGNSTTFSTTRTLAANEAYLWSDNSSANTLSVSTAGSYSLRIRNTATGCTSAVSNTITMVVNNLPNTPTIAGATAICSGSNTTLTTTRTLGANESYLWSNGTTTASTTVSTAGTYSLRIVNTITGCNSEASNAITLIVNALPTTPTIAGSTSICSGKSTTLTTTRTLGTNEEYLWSNGTTTASNTVSVAGAYSLRIRNTVTGCTSAVSNSISVTVNPIPSNLTVTPTTPAASCSAITLTASASAGNTYQWKLNGTNISGATSSTYSAGTTGSYTVVAVTPQGCSSAAVSNTVAVTVNSLATPTISGATTICSGSSTTLTTTYSLGTNEAYLWSNNSSASTLLVSTAGTYSLRVRNTVTGCTSAVSNTITVSVITLPTTRSITPATPATTCGTSVTLTSSTSTGNTYQWKFNGTDIPGANAVTYSAAISGNYTVVAVTPQGCSSAAVSNTVAVTVNPLPTTPVISGATAICTGSNTTITTTRTLGTNEAYLWSNNSNASTLTVSAAGTYSLRIRNTVTACTSAVSNTITIVVNTLPTTRAITPATPAATCGTAVTLTSSTSTGNTYQWKLNGVDIPGATSVTYNAPISGNYTVVAVTPQGCSSAAVSNTVAVTVNTITPTISGATTICSGSSTTLTTTRVLVANEAYLWSDNSSASTLSVSTAGTYSLRIRNTVNGCTSAVSNAIALVVNTMPATPTISGNAAFCFGTSTVLTSSAATGNLWSNGETTQSITVLAPGTYSVQQISGACTTITSAPVETSTIPTGTWLGTTTDWNNTSNWCGGVPTETTDITLGSTGTLPAITGTTATCKNLTIPAGVTLNIGSGANFNLAGNLSGLGNIAGISGSTLTLIGTTAQTIQRVNVGTLVLNNSAGALLGGNVIVKDGVTLTNGILNTQGHNLILLGTATSPVETANSYIYGTIRNNTRMIGTGSGTMFGITIAAGTDNLDTVMVERGENPATYNGNQGIGHIWKIRAGNQPISGRQITLAWNPRADNGKDVTRLQVYRRPDTGGEWIRMGSVVDGSSRSITLTTNSFSDWTVSDQDAPLPVTLTSFTGKSTLFGNQLNWSTSSEVNNQGFNIERSTDGKIFTKIGLVKGFGTTNTKQAYQFTDTQLSEAYYRLQQVDFDGKTEYSATIKVGESNLVNSLSIYPNPASDKVTITTNGTGTIEIVNNLGQVLITQPAFGTNDINISKLAMGVYTVKFNGISQKLVVR